jgi:hypothetical protein
MVEGRGQILAEEPVEQADAAHDRQGVAHQPARGLEEEHDQQAAGDEIHVGGSPSRRISS